MRNFKEAGLDGELKKLMDDAESMQSSSGAGAGTVAVTYTLLSYYMGNKGYVCTWTVECQNNCRKN